jgi:chloramphenicol-sensitive protein RarD
VAYGLAAYTWWGVVVVYFKAVSHVPSLEVLAHRIVWALVLLSTLLALRHRWPQVLAAVRTRRTLLTLVATAFLVAINWLTFIWAVSHSRVVQASLGYFTNPLVNVLLGFLFLRERLRPAQWVSVALAAVGVTYLTVALGEVPWIALTLAFSFGFYGLLRKVAAVGALEGLTIEAMVLLPIAGSYLIFLASRGSLVFGHRDVRTDGLLVAAGAVTALPLLWFSNAARRLRLATVGFLQYLAPSLQLMLGVLLYGEPFRRHHQITFAFIWTALAIYSIETYRGRPRRA